MRTRLTKLLFEKLGFLFSFVLLLFPLFSHFFRKFRSEAVGGAKNQMVTSGASRDIPLSSYILLFIYLLPNAWIVCNRESAGRPAPGFHVQKVTPAGPPLLNMARPGIPGIPRISLKPFEKQCKMNFRLRMGGPGWLAGWAGLAGLAGISWDPRTGIPGNPGFP